MKHAANFALYALGFIFGTGALLVGILNLWLLYSAVKMMVVPEVVFLPIPREISPITPFAPFAPQSLDLTPL